LCQSLEDHEESIQDATDDRNRWDASEFGALKLSDLKKEHKKLERELEQLTDSIDWSEQASIMEKQREIDVSFAQTKKLEEERPALVKKLNNPNH
jgi:peptidoglycan hydrolase CwlO-like protein